MEIASKALYNSLRINWLRNPHFPIESWKVQDYRALTLEEIFSKLREYDIVLDRNSFITYSDEFDSPEELTENILFDLEHDIDSYDQIYLFLFELWRRITPEKPSISIICDELDYQIFHHDSGNEPGFEALQDALSMFLNVLEENVDHGIDPKIAFLTICEYCAHDISLFLSDYISDLIDEQSYDYAGELLENFYAFLNEKKRFDFLRAKLYGVKDFAKANELLREVFEENVKDPDLQLNFDLLEFMVHGGDINLFRKIVEHTLTLLYEEEDFLDLLAICADFERCLDEDQKQQALEKLLAAREHEHKKGPFSLNDPYVPMFCSLMEIPLAFTDVISRSLINRNSKKSQETN